MLWALIALAVVGTIVGVGSSHYQNAKNAQFQEDAQSFSAEQQEDSQQFNAAQAEEAYNRQVEFYENYQSPKALVNQYREAGINPALMFGGSVGGSSTPQPAASSSPVGAGSSSASPLSALGPITELMNTLSMLKVNESIANKNNADASKTSQEASWIDTYNSTQIDVMRAGIDEVRSNIEVNSAKVSESLQNVQESIKRMDKMTSEIAVNGALVDLHGSQQVLNESRSAVERMNVKQMEMLLPYVQARQEAEISFTNAKTEEARMSAENHMYEANLKMLKSLVDAKLIDSSYYDSVIDQAHWDAKYKKREYKWKPVNDICHNVSMLCIGAGSVMSGTGSILGNKSAVDGVKEVATMNYF